MCIYIYMYVYGMCQTMYIYILWCSTIIDIPYGTIHGAISHDIYIYVIIYIYMYYNIYIYMYYNTYDNIYIL